MEFSLSALMAIFPGEPGLAGFAGAKDNKGGDDKTEKAAYNPVLCYT